MTLWGTNGQTVVMVRGRMKLPPETFDLDGVTYRTTPYLPSLKRCDKPEPGTLEITDPEA